MRTLVVGTLAATLGEKPQSDDIRDRPNLATKKAKSALAAAKVEPPASGQAAEASDPVITIAKTEIAAKTEKPPSDDERDKADFATTKAKSTMAAAKVEPPVIGRDRRAVRSSHYYGEDRDRREVGGSGVCRVR